ncbi:MAG TPA: glycosyltransferase family 4 protein [Kofleriaceae bacterium]|nr:glycosyltransferase family 4 protein [Kofleriaceae bacterium]
MRIGVVTASYPRFAGDWAGNFVGEHVAALRAAGHDVDVIGAHRIASELFYRGGAPDELGDPRAWPAGAAFTARLAAYVAAHARRWDLIVAHWLAPSALAALAAPRVPLLAIAHGGDIHLLRRARLLRPVLHALRLRRARLAFVSAELLDIARAHGFRSDALVQPMGVPLARFATIPRAPTDPPRVAVVARLVPLKGVDVAIRALAHVRAPIDLAIAGDGPARGELEQLAAGRARFLGAVDETARDRLLATASAVVVPSRVVAGGRSEGLPLVALEALAAGVPLVASAVGGLPTLASVAALVPPDDPHALAAAIDRVLAAPPPAPALREAVSGLGWADVSARLLAHVA